jgi:hypothetical protein
MKNITLSMEEETLKAGREYAQMHNLSFNDLVRKLVAQTVLPGKNLWLEDTFTLMNMLNVSSEGRSWTREELYRV